MQTVQERSNRPFVSSSRRFSAPSTGPSTNPGPGQYDSSFDWQPHGSLGHKGYGFLASNTSRLSNRVEYTGPGPGTYRPHDPSSRRTRSAAFCSTAFKAADHANTSNTFSSSSTAAAESVRQYMPSTTHTGDAITWASSRRPGASAAFKGTSRSTVIPGSADDLAREQKRLQQGSSTPDWVKQVSTTAAKQQLAAQYKKGKYKSCAKQHQRDPNASARLSYRTAAAVFGGQPHGWSLPQLADRPKSHCCLFEGAVRTAAQLPGPGAYNPAPPIFNHQRCSPMFAQPLAATSPSHTVQQQDPLEALVKQQHVQDSSKHGRKQRSYPVGSSRLNVQSGSAPFKSTVPGHEAASISPQDILKLGMPGPAYYSQVAKPRKTTFRRANGVFVGAV